MFGRNKPQQIKASAGPKIRDVVTDPLLPILIASTLASCFYLAFILEAPAELVISISLFGILAAVVEVVTRHRLGLKG